MAKEPYNPEVAGVDDDPELKAPDPWDATKDVDTLREHCRLLRDQRDEAAQQEQNAAKRVATLQGNVRQLEHDKSQLELRNNNFAAQRHQDVEKIEAQATAIGTLTERLAVASKENARLTQELANAKTEANNLRDLLMTTTMNLERLRGYMDAIEDTKPPVMTPERRQANSDRLRNAETHIYAGIGSRSKPWYQA